METETMASRALDEDGQRGARDYHAYMRATEPLLVVSTVEQEFLNWLQGKGLAPIAIEGDWVGGDRSASTRRIKVGDDELLSCRLVEPNVTLGTWSTEVVASSAGWIDLRVTNSAGKLVSVPNLAKTLMQKLDLKDASLQLQDNVKVWDVGDLDQLVELLEDPDRHGLVFVAGTGPDPRLYDAFHDRIPVWTREVFGLAQSIVLTPQATWALGERLAFHAVAPWTLRTYYPGVDAGSVVDARRHRYLRTATLATEKDHRLRSVLAEVARRHAATRTEPQSVIAAKREFERAETRELLVVMDTVEARHASETVAPPLPPTAVREPVKVDQNAVIDTLHQQLEIVRAVLGVTDLSSVSIRTAVATLAKVEARDVLADSIRAASLRIKEQSARVEDLEDRLRGTQLLLDDDELEHAILQQEFDSARAEARWLREKLTELAEHETAYGVTPDAFVTDYPETCEEVVARLRDDDVLVFTGDLNCVRAVDAVDSLQAAARAAWDACLSLREYARARADGACESGVDHFLRHRPQGYSGMPPGKHAVTETKATMTQFGDERVFPVPERVDESGRMTMTAHFKLSRAGRTSPRLYYFDDFPKSGRIYIGYIGRHLTNTQSN